MKSKALWMKSKQIRRNTGLTPEKEKTVQPRLRGYTVSLPKKSLWGLWLNLHSLFFLFLLSVEQHAVVVKRLAGAGPEAVEEVLNGHALTLGA